jgi:uncharacterized membrane protein YoaK (UPF0700 family)
MISKLPKWVWLGAAVLSFCAGMVNVIAILGFVHKGITHVTGNTSLLSIAILDGDRKNTLQLFSIVISFFLGSVLAGFIIGDAHLRMGRRYGFALAIESALLLASTYGLVRGSIYGEYFASMAAGLQNAMASTYSEAIVRTTHMTGILTDIGALVGNKIRGIKIDKKRIKLLSIIFFSFLSGGFLGAYCYHYLGSLAMLVPTGIIGASAIGYEFFRQQVAKSTV